MIGVLIILVFAMGLLLPGSDPWDEERTFEAADIASLPLVVAMGGLWGLLLSLPLVGLGLISLSGGWSWRPGLLAVAATVYALSVALIVLLVVTSNLGGLVLPFERVMAESWLPWATVGVAFVAVLGSAPIALRRFR